MSINLPSTSPTMRALETSASSDAQKRAKALRQPKADEEERLAFLNENHWVSYPTGARIRARLEDLFSWKGIQEAPEPPALLIASPVGGGKTMIARRFLNEHPPENDGYGRETLHVPVALAMTPAVPRSGRFAESTLRDLGVPFDAYEEENASGKQGRLAKVLSNLKTRLLVVDEFQNIGTGYDQQQEQLLSGLLSAAREASVAIVALGTESESERVLAAREKASEQFEVETLRPFEPESEDLEAFLIGLGELLPLRHGSGLDNAEIRKGVLGLTEIGTIGEVTEVTKRAARQAISSGEERITPSVLEETHAIGEHMRLSAARELMMEGAERNS